MREHVPNLFRTAEAQHASQIYDQFLCRLLLAGRHRRIVEACRQIRRFAASAGDVSAGSFTYEQEEIALVELRDWTTLWRRLRARERTFFGNNADLGGGRWSRERERFLYYYTPLLYFRGEYALGARLLERKLYWMQIHGGSYECQYDVWKQRGRPRRTYDVTLWHFYQGLGRDLTSWRGWKAFAGGFPEQLYAKSGIAREALLADSSRLFPFVRWMSAERDRLAVSGTTAGVADLIESPEQVLERQEETKAKIASIAHGEQMRGWDERIRAQFPELDTMPDFSQIFDFVASQNTERIRPTERKRPRG
jgi:hypothetical protein